MIDSVSYLLLSISNGVPDYLPAGLPEVCDGLHPLIHLHSSSVGRSRPSDNISERHWSEQVVD